MISRLSDEELKTVKENALTLKDKLNNLLAKVPDFINDLDVVNDGVTALQDTDLVNQLINALSTNADQLLPLLQSVVGSKEKGKVSEGKVNSKVLRRKMAAKLRELMARVYARNVKLSRVAADDENKGLIAKVQFQMNYDLTPLDSDGNAYVFASTEEQRQFEADVSRCVYYLAQTSGQQSGTDTFLGVIIHNINQWIGDFLENYGNRDVDTNLLSREDRVWVEKDVYTKTQSWGSYDASSRKLAVIVETTLSTTTLKNQEDAEDLKTYIVYGIEQAEGDADQLESALGKLYNAEADVSLRDSDTNNEPYKGTIDGVTDFKVSFSGVSNVTLKSENGLIKAWKDNALLRRLKARLSVAS